MSDRLQAIGDPELRRALLFARSSAEPITVDELAQAAGVHRNVARARLDRLADASLLEPSFERRTGRTGPGAGRPARTYAVAPETSAIEFPTRRYDTLIGFLVSALPVRGRSRRLREVGEAFGAELAHASPLARAGNLPDAVEGICRTLGDLGFHASVEKAEEEEAWICTATCPVRPLVVASPDLVAVDNGMWAGLVRHALADRDHVRVECKGHDCLNESGPCRVRIRVS